MACPTPTGSFRGRASSTTTSLISLKKTAGNIGYCQALAPQAAGTCDASPSDPKEPPGRKPVILGIGFHICMPSMSNGDLAFR
jgi:hypothetical protein